MTGFSEIVRHLFLLAVMVYCLVVPAIAVVVLLLRFHENWFVSDAVRFARCPNCGAAKSGDGRSSLMLLLSPRPPAGAFVNRRFGRFVRCRVCDALVSHLAGAIEHRSLVRGTGTLILKLSIERNRVR